MTATGHETGKRNLSNGVDTVGLSDLGHVYYNLNEPQLYQQALSRGEAVVTAQGALRALTGQHTGRSAQDKFVVRDEMTAPQVWWDNNKALSPEHFETLLADFQEHAKGKELFVQDLVGAKIKQT